MEKADVKIDSWKPAESHDKFKYPKKSKKIKEEVEEKLTSELKNVLDEGKKNHR